MRKVRYIKLYIQLHIKQHCCQDAFCASPASVDLHRQCNAAWVWGVSQWWGGLAARRERGRAALPPLFSCLSCLQFDKNCLNVGNKVQWGRERGEHVYGFLHFWYQTDSTHFDRLRFCFRTELECKTAFQGHQIHQRPQRAKLAVFGLSSASSHDANSSEAHMDQALSKKWLTADAD